ncbi:hypothetical protein EOPP23_15440 [Endozoicomonas sp. OPT23]|uniref:DUF4892 domain-containing protein n=1 Tax=Endozoicomonas sp. OPT23 TaxID=2072845 RepID=UPI00129A3F44|nr:DUF4892 domain-containing protein [Endozoicomonas sp. OPT23]MRI34382.1 hypothetical protein [Endozoicomonas sp. OPT23]
MPVFRFPLVLTLLGVLLPTTGWTAADDIKSFPNARIDLEESRQVTSYPIVSSTIKKVNGQVTADEEKWLSGDLERTLYLLPNGRSSEQAFEYFREQLLKLGVAPLFECDRFSCGESNFWANNIFKISRLYGLDKAQSYFVGSRLEAGKTVYYLVYTIRRGNKREYALMDVFTEGKKVSQLSSDEYSIQLPLNAEAFKKIEAFKQVVSSAADKVALISISSSEAQNNVDLKTKLSQLTDARRAVRRALISKGVSEERFYIQTQVGQASSDSLSVLLLEP